MADGIGKMRDKSGVREKDRMWLRSRKLWKIGGR